MLPKCPSQTITANSSSKFEKQLTILLSFKSEVSHVSSAIGSSYDSIPWFAKAKAQIQEGIISRLDWLDIPLLNPNDNKDEEQQPKEVKLLDYACGTGLMAECLAPYVTVTRGIDLSTTMVESFNKKHLSLGIPAEKTHAVVGDLFTDPVDSMFEGEEWWGFDIVSVGAAFHHFEGPVEAARRLKERLRPGGVVLISDMLEGGDVPVKEGEGGEGGSEEEIGDGHGHHHHHHGHGHEHGHGHAETQEDSDDPLLKHQDKMKKSIVQFFDVEGIKKVFEEAGLVDVDVRVLDERIWTNFGGNRTWKTIFLAKGKRPDIETKSEL